MDVLSGLEEQEMAKRTKYADCSGINCREYLWSNERHSAMNLEYKSEPEEAENWRDEERSRESGLREVSRGKMVESGREGCGTVDKEGECMERIGEKRIKTESVGEGVNFRHGREKRRAAEEAPERICSEELPLLVSPEKEKVYRCRICCKILKNHRNLLRHRKTHAGEVRGNNSKTKRSLMMFNPYECDQCGYKSYHKSDMKKHSFVHSGEKPYACGLCEYRTSRNGSLKVHLRVHTGEKPYKCSQCKFRTSVKSHLKAHLYRHSGERPLNCNLCGYRTSDRSALKRHILVHTGLRPFKCHLCKYCSCRKSDLRKHLKRHDTKKQLKCDEMKYESIEE